MPRSASNRDELFTATSPTTSIRQTTSTSPNCSRRAQVNATAANNADVSLFADDAGTARCIANIRAALEKLPKASLYWTLLDWTLLCSALLCAALLYSTLLYF